MRRMEVTWSVAYKRIYSIVAKENLCLGDVLNVPLIERTENWYARVYLQLVKMNCLWCFFCLGFRFCIPVRPCPYWSAAAGEWWYRLDLEEKMIMESWASGCLTATLWMCFFYSSNHLKKIDIIDAIRCNFIDVSNSLGCRKNTNNGPFRRHWIVRLHVRSWRTFWSRGSRGEFGSIDEPVPDASCRFDLGTVLHYSLRRREFMNAIWIIIKELKFWFIYQCNRLLI